MRLLLRRRPRPERPASSRAGEFCVIVATDGSPAAIAAVATTLAFPWPEKTRVVGVVARRTATTSGRPGYVLNAWDRHWSRVVNATRHALARRFADPAVSLVDDHPPEAILGEVKRCGADVVVLGWRGHGAFHRLLMGSISRSVARRAPCSVLVTRRRPRTIRSLVLGVDGSRNAKRAVELVARLRPARGGQVTVVQVVEPMALPSLGKLPGAVRRALGREAQEVAGTRVDHAERSVEAAAETLRAAGWKARGTVRTGAPLTELLSATTDASADVLVVGSRGTGGVERLLLGSIAEGALDRSPVPVLVVR
jgi:nucleotide-binding universal stress UspA family protein